MMTLLKCFIEMKEGMRRDEREEEGRRGRAGEEGNQTTVSHIHPVFWMSRGKGKSSLVAPTGLKGKFSRLWG